MKRNYKNRKRKQVNKLQEWTVKYSKAYKTLEINSGKKTTKEQLKKLTNEGDLLIAREKSIVNKSQVSKLMQLEVQITVNALTHLLDLYIVQEGNKAPKVDMRSIEKFFSIMPSSIVIALHNKGGFENLCQKLAKQALDDNKIDIEEKKPLLNLYLRLLYGGNHDDSFKDTIFKYIKDRKYHETLKQAILETQNWSELFNEEELIKLGYALDINIDNLPVTIVAVDSQKLVANIDKNSDKDHITNLVRKGKTESVISQSVEKELLGQIRFCFDAIGEFRYNSLHFIDYTLNCINLVEDTEKALRLYKKLFKCVKGATFKRKVSDARDLYKTIHNIIDPKNQDSKSSSAENDQEQEAEEKVNIKALAMEAEQLLQKDEEKSHTVFKEHGSTELVTTEANNTSSASSSSSSKKSNSSSFLPEEAQAPANILSLLVEERKDNQFKIIDAAYKLQKKIFKEEKENKSLAKKAISWFVKGVEYIFNSDDKQPDQESSGKILKIFTSFGQKLYVTISSEMQDVIESNQLTKFKSALGHWAGAFMGKSGIKALFSQAKHKKLCGFEVKIMKDDARLFSDTKYINQDGDELIIFDTIIGHKNEIKNEINIVNIGENTELEESE